MDDVNPSAEQPAQATPPPSGPRLTRDEMKDLGRLRRSVTDRYVAGVAGGIARHLDIDPIIVRVALAVGAFFGGAGLIVYVAAWLLVPEEGTADEPLGLDERNRTIALGAAGVLALVAALSDWAGAFWFPWPLAIVAALVVWFLHRKQPGSPPPRAGTTYAGPMEPTAYAPPPEPAWAPPTDPAWTSYARTPRPEPRTPRRRGPILFWFTLALIALAEGVLGVVDVAGVTVADSAYPALALGITAVMLVLGSFWGRAGGLILLGLVAAITTAVTTVNSTIGDENRYVAPTTAAGVEDTYDFGGGRFTLDLSGVSDVDGLDGRDVAIDAVGGQVDVIVPEGMDVDVRAEVVGGSAVVFGQRSGGFAISQEGFVDGGDGVPDMSITIDLVGGEVVVREAA
ncbi:PspC domain-containing protein [Nocardioides sp. zg-1228]|uniref:PspC domain-containing protein n=1 Tax=Nocardioides sp. zg-1228 TaxID=2763008 RepID=UPI00164313B8|nr:PspC domain-containing protein [Nocardioides sp. zg-1228]MBC2933699.1 PspC domain-containing protein [Nocardioides sp. zg-1228]QSF58482.1 PspC domain-containing protein [Nocardioides sp. zg-1228]